MKIVFDVFNPGEPAAGIIGYTDTVTIEIQSGEPGGEPGEFENHIQEALADWFDGAKITRNPNQREQ